MTSRPGTCWPRERSIKASSGAPFADPHAKTVLCERDQLDDIPDADLYWLAVERAAIAVAEGNPDEALTTLWVSYLGRMPKTGYR